MCVEKAVTVIAIFGETAVGKSAAAAAVASRLGWPVRHCGDEVKRRATQLGISPAELSDDEHRRIDRATCDYVENRRGCVVVEGRFLNHVLAGWSDVTLVQLKCDEVVRRGRYMRRGRLAEAVARGEMSSRERADRELEARLYESQAGSSAGGRHVIDNSSIGVSETVAMIIGALNV